MIYTIEKVSDSKSLNERRGGRLNSFFIGMDAVPRLGTYPLQIEVYDYRLTWDEASESWSKSLYAERGDKYTKLLTLGADETDSLIAQLNAGSDVFGLIDMVSLQKNNADNTWGCAWSLTPPTNE